MANSDDRKKRIMEHIARSTGDFVKPQPQMSDQRREQMMDHVRRTRSQDTFGNSRFGNRF